MSCATKAACRELHAGADQLQVLNTKRHSSAVVNCTRGQISYNSRRSALPERQVVNCTRGQISYNAIMLCPL